MWEKIKNFYFKPKAARDIDVEFRRIWINNWTTHEVFVLTMEARTPQERRPYDGTW